MSIETRVFVTGCGSVSCLPAGSDFIHGPAAPAQDADAPLPRTRRVAGDPAAFCSDDPAARRMDRFTLLAYAAVRQALAHADVRMAELQQDRVGLIMNTCYGPLDSTRRYISKLIRDGARKVPAAVFPNTVHNAFTGLITMELKAHGTNSTVSGHNPICYGLDAIRQGRDDVLIVGGCDELLEVMARGFEASGGYDGHRATAATAAAGATLDGGQNAFVLGEGAAVLVLESEASVRRRGAVPLAEVMAYGMSNGLGDAAGGAFPADARGMELAMRQSLRLSGLRAEQVHYVSAAANGLPHVDRAEAQALQRVFADASRLALGNVKPLVGETLGAASVFSALQAVQALQPAAAAAAQRRDHALVNSIELGGTMTSLAFSRVAAFND